MRIGIGITTYNRPQHLDLCLKQMNKFMPKDSMIFIADDTKRDGIAKQKNKCIEALKECDYIFLFDDDCFPIADNWWDSYINDYIRTGNHHYLKINEMPNIEVQEVVDGISVWTNCAGCMVFITKSIVETIGGFNEDFGVYGFEHAEYSQRIYKAGFNPSGQYLSCIGNDKIYSLDLQGVGKFNINHKPSMPFKEMVGHVKKSSEFFKKLAL